MEECNICLTKTKKQNKNKHEQSKKHKYFSNLIINKYIVRNDEIDKFKDIIQSYFNKHKRKIDIFTICAMWRKNEMGVNKLSVSSTITVQKPYLFGPSMFELPLVVRVSPLDFPDTFDRSCIKDELDERNIIFTSDLKDVTFSQYMAQPNSMLCRKLVRIFFENFLGILIIFGFQYALDI